MLASYDLRTRASAIPPDRSIDFAARLLDRLRSTPGIEAAAISTVVPLDIHASISIGCRRRASARMPSRIRR